MATGALDANGVWLYGEDDNPDGTASGLLNVGMQSISDTIGPASARARKRFLWPDAAARAAQTGMSNGDDGYQSDTTVTYLRIASAWKPWTSDWISFTPTLTNIAVGTGGSALNSCRYKYSAGQVVAEYKLVLGSSGASVGSAPTVTLPVTAETLTHNLQVIDGLGSMYDTSATDLRIGVMQHTSTTVARFSYITPSGIGFTVPTSTAPWTWAAGDAIHQIIRYAPA